MKPRPLPRRNLLDASALDLQDTREQLRRAQERLEQYQAALRLANVEIRRRNRNVIALMTFAYQANRTADPTTLLKLALVQALETTGTPVGAIVVIDKDSSELTLGVHKGLTPELSEILTGRQVGAGAVTLMPHLVAGSGALLEYHSTDDQMERLLLASGNLTSLVSLPLQIGSRLAGAFLVGLQSKKAFTSAELCFLMALAQETAVALESLNLRESLWRTAESLLGHPDETLAARFQEVQGDTQLDLTVPTPFELPDIPETSAEQVQEDLEQLLAAMMEAEEEVQLQNIDLQTLNDIAETLNRTMDLDEIVQSAVNKIRETLQTDAAWLYLVDENNILEMKAHTGLSATYVRAMYQLRLSDGLEGQAVLDQKPYFVENVLEDSRDHKIWVDKEGLQNIGAVPLTRPDTEDEENTPRVVGVLAAGRRSNAARPWSPREIRMLTSVVHPIALAIDNARLHSRLQTNEVNQKLGSQVLKEVNDLLLDENTTLTELLNGKISPAMDAGQTVLGKLLGRSGNSLSHGQRNQLNTLQHILGRVKDLITDTFTKLR